MPILSHDLSSADALKRPSHSFSNKIKRLSWNIVRALLFRPSPTLFHSWRSFLLRTYGAKIGESNFIYPSSKIWAPWLLETEDVVTIGPDVEIYNPGGVKLGHHTILSQGAFLCGATHDYNSPDFTYISRPIVTHSYSWICAKAVVLPGVVVGEGAILGAAALTSKDLAPWSVNAGNPAKRVGDRNPEVATH